MLKQMVQSDTDIHSVFIRKLDVFVVTTIVLCRVVPPRIEGRNPLTAFAPAVQQYAVSSVTYIANPHFPSEIQIAYHIGNFLTIHKTET